MTSLNQWPHLANSTLIRERAKHLSQDHRQLMAELVKARVEVGMSQSDIAEIMGVTQQRVSQLEKYDADPKLSTVRRYANAVGAATRTIVIRTAKALPDYSADREETRPFLSMSAPQKRDLHPREWSNPTHAKRESFEVRLDLAA